MLSATSMFCVALLLTGNACDRVWTLDQMMQRVHADMAGEHWYQVRFRELKIGSIRESRSQLMSGEYVIDRSLRFSLMRNRITHVNERLLFSNEFPYRLLSAEQETTVTHNDTTTETHRVFPTDTMTSSPRSQLNYLATLAFHPQMMIDRDRVETRSIDFTIGQIKRNMWQVNRLLHEGSDYDLASADGLTTHAVSSKGVTVRTNMPGGVSMTIVDRPLDQPWEDNAYLFDRGQISIRVNRAIDQHHRLVALTLRLHADEDAKRLWASLSNGDDDIRIDLRTPLKADVPTAQAGTSHATDYSNASVTDLIAELNLERHATYVNVRRLVETLHERITYEDISHPSLIEETLERQTGDCTEFADVFDAVAIQLGWHSRIRTGLAYHPPSKTFRPHSWNEVVIDEHWISADASWGQLPADASHVPFPRGNTLALLAQAPHMWFEVVDQHYQAD